MRLRAQSGCLKEPVGGPFSLVDHTGRPHGRYAPQGLLRKRFIPRLMHARPEEIQGEDGTINPQKAWAVCMHNEKPGGHGERPVPVGVIDMAL
jgi:D(-)-tartrate dehydratase